MRTKEDLVHSLVKAVCGTDPAMLELAGGSLSAAVTKIQAELDDIERCGEGSGCSLCYAEPAQDWFVPALCHDLATLQICDLALIAIESEANEKRVYWHRFTAQPEPEFVLQTISICLYNALRALRRLVCGGLDAPAKVQLRHAIELWDILVAITGDRESFKKYRAASGSLEQTYGHWKRGLRPAQIRRVVGGLDAELKLPERMVAEGAVLREDAYRWLSGYAHASLAGQAFAAFASPDDEPGRIRPSLERTIRFESRRTLSQSVVYSVLSLQAVRYLLARRHRWNGLRGDQVRCFFMFRGELLVSLMLAAYPSLDGFGRRSGTLDFG